MESLLSQVATSDQVLDQEENDIVNFSPIPTDGRLLDNSFQCLSPISAVTPTSKEFEFKIAKNILPRWVVSFMSDILLTLTNCQFT